MFLSQLSIAVFTAKKANVQGTNIWNTGLNLLVTCIAFKVSVTEVTERLTSLAFHL